MRFRTRLGGALLQPLCTLELRELAKRPESRAVKPTRAQKARPPADESRSAAAAKQPERRHTSTESRPPSEAALPPVSPKGEARAVKAAPSPTRSTKPKTPLGVPAATASRKSEIVGPALAAKPAAEKRASKASSSSLRSAPARRPKRPPPYLAAELGHSVDHEGEPIGAGSPLARSDAQLQEYTLQLWQQMQSRRGVDQHVQSMERAGLTIDDLWTTGVTDRLATSSTPDEVRRYRQNLLFRANLLEAILTETVAELRRLETVEPTPAAPNGSG